MKIGIGIDTGGTCTDGVIYDLENKSILATAKSPTTKEDLSIGIGKTLDLLPVELLKQGEVMVLSTTLATNACVENKGGRGKLIFIGTDKKTIKQTAGKFGLPVDDTLIFIECKETLKGEIIQEPDWDSVKELLAQELKDCQAVGIVELFAEGTGGAMEKKTRELVNAMGIPTVCGYELFQEKNVVGRGAGALLNARLIFVIAEFLKAIRVAMNQRNLTMPIKIVRSDGSQMNEEVSKQRPVETLLCGPVASVMGAAELHHVKDAVVVDMGGTTTDISLIKDGVPLRAQGGITVGNWNIYVKGMYVDTFGLGGDTQVLLNLDGNLELGDCRILPICMAAMQYPKILEILEKEHKIENKINSWRKNIYVGLKDISKSELYSDTEKRIGAAFFHNPMTLSELEEKFGISLIPSSLNRLIEEGILMPVGITPTDAMHVLGDYCKYDTEAAKLAMENLGAIYGKTATEVGENIYRLVIQKLYCNIVRILYQNRYPKSAKAEVSNQVKEQILDMYQRAVTKKEDTNFLQFSFACHVPLIGVGGPIGTFLPKVAELLGTTALISPYSQVANALGAIVGNIQVIMSFEIKPVPEKDTFQVFGNGVRFEADSLEEARSYAEEKGKILAIEEAMRRGATMERISLSTEYENVEFTTRYGNSGFLSEKVHVKAVFQE